MRAIYTVLILVLSTSAAYAQIQTPKPKPTTSGCCSNGKPKPWAAYDKGVVWKRTLEAAQEASRATGKPIMLFQLVGDLDLEGC